MIANSNLRCSDFCSALPHIEPNLEIEIKNGSSELSGCYGTFLTWREYQETEYRVSERKRMDYDQFTSISHNIVRTIRDERCLLVFISTAIVANKNLEPRQPNCQFKLGTRRTRTFNLAALYRGSLKRDRLVSLIPLMNEETQNSFYI